jgi:BolA protein
MRMASVAQKIRTLLETEFAPTRLEVIDDSAKHAGHSGAREGGESHFTVKIESAHFEGLSRVARHRAVYSMLQPLFDQGLHALAIEAEAPKN